MIDLIKLDLLTQLNKHLQKPTFTSALHETNFENVVGSLGRVVVFRKEQVYQDYRLSIDSLVESQIDLAQRLKRTETLKYWQWVQKRLINIVRAEEGGEV